MKFFLLLFISVAVFLRVLLGCTLSALASNKEGYYLNAMS